MADGQSDHRTTQCCCSVAGFAAASLRSLSLGCPLCPEPLPLPSPPPAGLWSVCGSVRGFVRWVVGGGTALNSRQRGATLGRRVVHWQVYHEGDVSLRRRPPHLRRRGQLRIRRQGGLLAGGGAAAAQAQLPRLARLLFCWRLVCLHTCHTRLSWLSFCRSRSRQGQFRSRRRGCAAVAVVLLPAAAAGT